MMKLFLVLKLSEPQPFQKFEGLSPQPYLPAAYARLAVVLLSSASIEPEPVSDDGTYEQPGFKLSLTRSNPARLLPGFTRKFIDRGPHMPNTNA